MKKEEIISLIKISTLALILSFGISFVSAQQAWVGPAQPAPGGNPPAPINTGPTAQDKEGNFSVGGSFLANLNSAFLGDVEIEGNLYLPYAAGKKGQVLTLLEAGGEDEGLAWWALPGPFVTLTAGGQGAMSNSNTYYLSTDGVQHSSDFGIMMGEGIQPGGEGSIYYMDGSILSISGSSRITNFVNRGGNTKLIYEVGVVGTNDKLSVEVDVDGNGIVKAFEYEDRYDLEFGPSDMIWIRQIHSGPSPFTAESIVRVLVQFDDVFFQETQEAQLGTGFGGGEGGPGIGLESN